MNFLLVGRPNVGKSSIFNILIGQKTNIIHINEGTTRDWHKEKINLISNTFIYDSPGIILQKNKEETKKIKRIIESLIFKIDCLLFVIDFQSTQNSSDTIIHKWLRSFNKEIILIINKHDHNNKNVNTAFYNFGIHNIFVFSTILVIVN